MTPGPTAPTEDSRPPPLRQFLAFLERFARDPRSVGAVAPSSRYLAAKMLLDVEWHPGVRLVEFGAGTGALTVAILEAMPEGGHFLGIERDPVFVELLRARFPGVDFAGDSVERLLELAEARDLLPIDHVISGLPFTTLPRDLTREILLATREALRPGGTFTTFQYLHSYPLPSARAFRRLMEELLGPRVARRVEFRNLPPAFVFTWQKPTAG